MCEKINLMSNTNKDINNPKRNERGAALVMTLLITTLLLGFCGALLMTTSGTAANTFNSTAEMQAYYAAETGLQATLDVLRGNVAPVDPLLAAANTKITFLNAITPAKSNYFGDPISVSVAGAENSPVNVLTTTISIFLTALLGPYPVT